jgi:hypothetical protein
LLTTADKRATVWLFRPGGDVRRIELGAAVQSVDQLAVADDGTMYVSHAVGPVRMISRITASGKVSRVVGNGQVGFTPDGGAATGPDAGVGGITVDREGRLVYGEIRYDAASNQNMGLVRLVEADGRIRTIAGRSEPFRSSREYGDGMLGSVSPPAGAKALGWPLPGSSQLGSLATGKDDTIFAQSEGGVLAFAPDGTVHSVARRRDPSAAPVADHPFSHEGDAADAEPRFTDGSGVAEDNGYVAMPVTTARPDTLRSVPAGFRRTGDYTPGQQAIVDSAGQGAVGMRRQEIVRVVLPDGSLTTAGWAVQGSALRDGWLYLLTTSKDDQLLIGRVKLPN